MAGPGRATALPLLQGVYAGDRVAYQLSPFLRAYVTGVREAGQPIDADVDAFVLAMHLAAERWMSGSGHGRRTSADMASSSGRQRLLTATQVADQLQCTERHARRLASGALAGRKQGRSWVVERSQVDSYMRSTT